ncbi:MAG: dienelactone hydrolase family protein [Burkholderiaceae bacterium]
MTHNILLTSADGFSFPVYLAKPSGAPKAAIVVVQEIFGVNSHIRAVADGYAAQGYLAFAPAAFQRVESDVELGYTQADIDRGVALKAAVQALPAPGVMADLQAVVTHAGANGKVGMVGYCWGGLLTWRSACSLEGLHAAVAYYGGGITTAEEREHKPRCPVLCHFGNQDHAISNDSVDSLRIAQPQVQVQVYPASHGFNCDQRGSFDTKAAKLAFERSIEFLARHLA